MIFRRCPSALLLVALSTFTAAGPAVVRGAEEFIPRKQTKPPNKPYTPAEAIGRMTVPEGFSVELVAAEPDIVNPVAMTFDERGRIWITESLEYPRRAPGKGQDQVKVLEDTDGDGTAETVKIFAEGLNIPSGIAVGHGGVWVANAPDILFYPDADRDGVADGPPQVVVSGFGRDDTHELPNSLTWGPDGYLYGLNGVFNASKVVQNGKTFEFTCAMFRIHPRTREFSLFCEGTSNPWGIAFNDNGDAFVSACVIDHLWHLTETGYYHRQGGPYPQHTWKLESIVDYKHQMAAYCGITWFDSDAYPEKYRNKLYMGNVHGGCINVDRLERNGATYRGKQEPDFLSANDAWFMPVVQKTGPDGCLYVLDWYDRYHCYQDANYDPKGVDRLKGRLYRVRYQETPRAAKFDLANETDDQLIERLKSPNVFYREIAQRLLAERNTATTRKKLEAIVSTATESRSLRLHALWAMIGTGTLDPAFHLDLLEDHLKYPPVLRAWGVRAAGNLGVKDPDLIRHVTRLTTAPNPEIVTQAAIASRKLLGSESMPHLLSAAGDELNRKIAWQNLLTILDAVAPKLADAALQGVGSVNSLDHGLWRGSATLGGFVSLSPRLIDWQFARGDEGAAQVADWAARLVGVKNRIVQEEYTDLFLDEIAGRVLAGGLTATQTAILRKPLEQAYLVLSTSDQDEPRAFRAAAVLCIWKHEPAVDRMRRISLDTGMVERRRLAGLDAWALSGDAEFLKSIQTLLTPSSGNSSVFRRRVLDAATRFDDASIADQVLSVYPQLEEDLKPAAVELLTSRVSWSNALVDAIGAGKVSKDAVNVNQIRKLLKTGHKGLAARVEATWGALRTDRNPQREQVVAKIRDMLLKSPAGDPKNGQVVFTRLCGQCHKIHGQGQEVGPDITSNGRASLDQMLSNIFDPSLVIGNAYRARIVSTADGRVLTGLLVEDNPQRIVLKLQGGKLETIARADVEEMEISKLSLMPEGVETQYKPEEIIDLFAFLKLDKPPSDPAAKVLPNFGDLPSGK